MSLVHLIYASRPFGYDELSLAGILASARANNQRDGITGCLICREDLYLQQLEGDQAAVKTAYERIARDPRHTEVSLLLSDTAPTRLFPDWAMRHDPAKSWMWTSAAVADGAVRRASIAELQAVFARVAREAT